MSSTDENDDPNSVKPERHCAVVESQLEAAMQALRVAAAASKQLSSDILAAENERQLAGRAMASEANELVRSYENELAGLRRSLEDDQWRLRAAETGFYMRGQQMDMQSSSIVALEQKNGVLKGERDALAAKHSALERESSTLRSALAQLETKLSTCKSDFAKRESTSAAWEHSLQNSLSDAQSQIRQLQADAKSAAASAKPQSQSAVAHTVYWDHVKELVTAARAAPAAGALNIFRQLQLEFHPDKTHVLQLKPLYTELSAFVNEAAAADAAARLRKA